MAYLRVSTDEQRLGPEAQRASVEAWAALAGVSVVAWHVDRGVSGGTDFEKRPALMATLAGLREHGAGVLVVAKRDRLARDVGIAATIEREAARLGARVVSAAGEGNGDTPADRFMRTVIDGAAEYERALARARTVAVLAEKKARRERAGSVPFGFRVAADGAHWTTKKGERECSPECAGCLHVEPDAAEQAIVARVRELHASGFSTRRIVAVLSAEGLVSPRSGRPLAQTQVVRLVRGLSARVAA